jgi:hypothetical protein
MNAFQAALSEGFCPDCLNPLQPWPECIGYCRRCRAWWQKGNVP